MTAVSYRCVLKWDDEDYSTLGHCSVQDIISKSHLFPFIVHSYPPHFSLILPPSCQGCSQAKTNTSYTRLLGLCFLACDWAIFDLVLVHGHLFSVVICHTIFIIFFFFNFKKKLFQSHSASLRCLWPLWLQDTQGGEILFHHKSIEMLKTRLHLDIVTLLVTFFLFTCLRRTQISVCVLYDQVLVVVLLPKNLVFHVSSGNTLTVTTGTSISQCFLRRSSKYIFIVIQFIFEACSLIHLYLKALW